MSEAIGASHLLDSQGPAPEMTRADAFAKRNELVHDADFTERLAKGDANAVAELRQVNHTITKVDFKNLGSEEQANAAAALDREARIEAFRKGADLPEDVAQHVREDRPVSREERRLAEAERIRLLADVEFRKQYLSGNRAARTRMALLSIVLGSRVAGAK